MSDVNKYIQRYAELLYSESFENELLNSGQKTINLFSGFNDETALYRYAENKWSLKEILQHLIDCERIFQFRALSFARSEIAHLPGFDEEFYALKSNADVREKADLVTEYNAVREATIYLFKSFSEEMMAKKGFANGNLISVKTTGQVICGHNIHHLNIIKERYLV